MQPEIADWIALNLVPGIGARTARMLLDRWQTPTALFNAAATELEQAGLNQEVLQALASQETRRIAGNHCERLTALGVEVLTLKDQHYPRLLKEIHDPPPVLYVQGDYQRAFKQPAIAIVGSRRCSSYGRHAAELLAAELASRGFTIISGLARGIDTAAHSAALAAGGKTVAVIGSGIDHIYPKENLALAEKIAENGAIISELPLGTPPLPQNFPFRNRIISGLCLGVVIVEAAERSGSLITARLAMEQNREVFAVPGNISSANSFGPNYLIKDGAKLVQHWRDIVEELPLDIRAVADKRDLRSEAVQQDLFPLTQLSDLEQKIYDLLKVDTPQHVDELAYASGLNTAELLSTLLALEVKDKIKQLPGKNFLKR